MQLGSFEKATVSFKNCLMQVEGYEPALFALGQIARLEGDLQLAIKQWQRLLDLNVITSYSIHYTKLYEAFAEASHVMPSGHPEGIYEAFANIYKGAAKSIRGEGFTDGEFPTVEDGVRGMKFIHAVVRSNANGNQWVDL